MARGYDMWWSSDGRAGKESDLDPQQTQKESQNVNLRSGADNGLLSHFHMKMKQINFEQRKKENSLAIRGPFSDSVQMAGSVTSSVAMGV